MKSKQVTTATKQSKDEKLISQALRCLESKMKYTSNEYFLSSKQVGAYFQLQIAAEKNEIFSVMFMNNKHQLISFEKMFYGTINEAVVYPRSIVQKALELNAAVVIVGHNHPSSGEAMPSEADINITKDLKKILGLISVKLLDHIIVTATGAFSFSDHQLI